MKAKLMSVNLRERAEDGASFLSLNFALPAVRRDGVLVNDSISYVENDASKVDDLRAKIGAIAELSGEQVPSGDGAEAVKTRRGGVCYDLRTGAPAGEGEFPTAASVSW